jgi:hypothetical protein
MQHGHHPRSEVLGNVAVQVRSEKWVNARGTGSPSILNCEQPAIADFIRVHRSIIVNVECIGDFEV